MTHRLRVLVKVDCEPHVATLIEVRRAFRELGVEVSILAVTYDRFNPTGAPAALELAGIPVQDMPRMDGSDTIAWSPGGLSLIRAEMPHVQRTLRGVIGAFRPHVAALNFDVGHFSLGFITECAAAAVPTVLIEEGLIVEDDGCEFCFSTRDAVAAALRPPRLRERAERKLRSLRHVRRGGHDGEELPSLRPFGTNGADRIACIGPKQRRLLIDRGITSSSLSVTGLPRFDAIWRGALEHQRLGEEEAGWPQRGGAPVQALLFQTMGFFYGHGLDVVVRELDMLQEASEALGPRFAFALRLRPEERRENYLLLQRQRFPSVSLETAETPVLERLALIDIALGSFSTCQIEAMMLGVPVVELSRNDPYGFAASGAALPAHNATELAAACRAIDADGGVRSALHRGRSDFLSDSVLFDGGASARVAELLIQTAGSEQKRR
jgi:hypothetical protein